MRLFSGIASLLMSIGSHAQPTPVDWQFLIPSQYHGDEAPAEAGTGWLALVAVGGIWRLEPTVVRSTRVFDPVLDAEGEKTGVEISSSHGEALALVRFPGMKAGKVDTPQMKFKDSPRYLSADGIPLKIAFKEDQYVIDTSVSGIFLQKGKLKTLLSGLSPGSAESEDSASLIWAGDLDRDGELDLLFSYSGYNNGGACLYLSGGAGEGALTRQAVCHGGVGC
jgi:hypothetical protein